MKGRAVHRSTDDAAWSYTELRRTSTGPKGEGVDRNATGPDRPRWQLAVPEENQEVLHRGDQVILDTLPFESAPAGALETVLRRGPTEAAFQQPLASPPVAARGRAVGLRAGAIEQFLCGIAFERAARFVLGAMGAQRTGITHAARRAVFVVKSDRRGKQKRPAQPRSESSPPDRCPPCGDCAGGCASPPRAPARRARPAR